MRTAIIIGRIFLGLGILFGFGAIWIPMYRERLLFSAIFSVLIWFFTEVYTEDEKTNDKYKLE